MPLFDPNDGALVVTAALVSATRMSPSTVSAARMTATAVISGEERVPNLHCGSRCRRVLAHPELRFHGSC